MTAPLPRYRNLTAPAPFAARWRQQAACHGTDLNLFYPERGKSAGPARQVCARCPVRQPCLDYALSNRITHGIWGGLTERERRPLHPAWCRTRGGIATGRSWPLTRPGTRRRRSAARSACPAPRSSGSWTAGTRRGRMSRPRGSHVMGALRVREPICGRAGRRRARTAGRPAGRYRAYLHRRGAPQAHRPGRGPAPGRGGR